MDTLPCPGCRTELRPEATGCPICLRARTKQEIMRGYAKLREDKATARARPFKLAGSVVLAGAAGWLIWTHHARIVSAYGAGSAALGHWTDEMTNPAAFSSQPPPPPEAQKQTAQEQISAARENKAVPAAPAAAASPAPAASKPAAAAAAPAPKKKRAAGDWRVSGVVYDIETLKPVTKVSVVFKRAGSDPVSAPVDEGGRYEADLAKGEGWTPVVEDASPIYRSGHIVDLDPPYRERDGDERKNAVQNLSSGDLAPVPFEGGKRGEITLNLVLVPEQWGGYRPP